MGDICGSVEMRHNCAHSSPVCELYAHLRPEDVSDSASNLCFVAFDRRLRNSQGKQPCETCSSPSCSGERSCVPNHLHESKTCSSPSCSCERSCVHDHFHESKRFGVSPLNVACRTEIPLRSTSHKYHAALTLPGRVQRQTHRVHAVVNIQARSGMFPSPGVGGREGRREREVRQHDVSTYRHVVYDVVIKRCNI